MARKKRGCRTNCAFSDRPYCDIGGHPRSAAWSGAPEVMPSERRPHVLEASDMTEAVDACSEWSVDYPRLVLLFLAIRGLAPEISLPPRSCSDGCIGK